MTAVVQLYTLDLDDGQLLSNPKPTFVSMSVCSCYEYGGSPEVTVGFNGAYQYRKWRTLGRVSHESA